MEYTQIIYQPGKVARVILNRPRYLNAQSRIMREEMDDAFARATADDEVCVIVLSGAGKSFSAGHDVGTEEEAADREARGYPTDRFGRYGWSRAFNLENTMRWRNVPKPTIAMVHGYCILGGWIFAAAMDLIFAAEDALFLPDLLQYFSVPWDIGAKKTKEVLFEHRFMTARELLEDGFVNRVFPAEKLEEETLAYAERVAENYAHDPLNLRMIKQAINHASDTQGFTAEMEVAFNYFCVKLGLEPQKVPKPEEGGVARTPVAKRNLELTRAWLEAKFKR
ncbi:MAG: enoyl-CoA hydratase-related protein [Chloroflexota bacterium]